MFGKRFYLLLSLSLGACEPDPVELVAFDREQLAGAEKADEAELLSGWCRSLGKPADCDICAETTPSFYGDGEHCDMFCQRFDPDCAPSLAEWCPGEIIIANDCDADDWNCYAADIVATFAGDCCEASVLEELDKTLATLPRDSNAFAEADGLIRACGVYQRAAECPASAFEGNQCDSADLACAASFINEANLDCCAVRNLELVGELSVLEHAEDDTFRGEVSRLKSACELRAFANACPGETVGRSDCDLGDVVCAAEVIVATFQQDCCSPDVRDVLRDSASSDTYEPVDRMDMLGGCEIAVPRSFDSAICPLAIKVNSEGVQAPDEMSENRLRADAIVESGLQDCCAADITNAVKDELGSDTHTDADRTDMLNACRVLNAR